MNHLLSLLLLRVSGARLQQPQIDDLAHLWLSRFSTVCGKDMNRVTIVELSEHRRLPAQQRCERCLEIYENPDLADG